MKMFPVVLSLSIFPFVANAQGLQDFFTGFLTLTNQILIPFLVGMAFLVFVINAIRYFVLGSRNEEGQGKAKALALYGVIAFVIIIIFWGMVNLLASSIGLEGRPAPTPDYIQLNQGQSNTPASRNSTPSRPTP